MGSNQEKSNDNNRKKKRYQIIAVCFFVGFLVFIVAFVAIHIRIQNAQDRLAALQSTANVTESTEAPTTEPPEETTVEETTISVLEERGIEIPEKNLDFVNMQEEVNEDIYAWIYIPDTVIDYPVLCHPGEDSYYLNRNLDGSIGYPGCIFSDPVNAADFSDPNTVLYGHNMRNGTMFGSLKNFRDREFFDDHRYVFVYTPEKNYVYEIYGAYEYPAVHLLYNMDTKSKAIFQNYLDQVLQINDISANFLEGTTLTYENRILTLSTCVRNQPQIRYLVQGVLLYEGDREQSEPEQQIESQGQNES